MKAWFTRIKQAVSGRLLSLKHKFGKAQVQRFAATVNARMQSARDWWKETFLITKCALLILTIKVSMALAPEARKGYRQWLKDLPGQFTKENFKKWAAAFLAWCKTLPETLRGLRKSGVLASLTLFALLLFMGHSATAAWLTYTTPVERNSFQVGKMDLHVEYRNDLTNGYVNMTEASKLFKDEALYEPGYTQVVRLYVRNDGNVPFDYAFVVRDYQSEPGRNVFGREFDLADHLKFGIVTADTEAALEAMLAPRDAARSLAQEYANLSLNGYSKRGLGTLQKGDDGYAALIVWMPEYVGNEANYREKAPQISLGITVYAQQAGTMDQ